MRSAATSGAILRFAAGVLGSTVAGWIAFRGEIFNIASPAFQCVTIGVVAAAILAMVRSGYTIGALRLVAAFAVLQFGATWHSGTFPALAMAAWSASIGLGVFLAATFFDLLAQLGIRFGKFLVVGPLLGGLYFAATPLASFVAGEPRGVLHSLWWNAFLGIVIGDGIGAAVEVIELVMAPPSSGPRNVIRVDPGPEAGPGTVRRSP
jgi:hypothetical protein